ncbi:hypothetical protein BGX38DRAFT_1262531 [Terfezia claveryi]|nr:hypothetical protein BGX38DRAFT_1262531 [Terfezia claveryi]
MPKLFCQVWGDSDAEPFPVKIDGGDTVGELKKLIIIEGPLSLRDMRAPNLKLWKWNKPDMVTDSDLDSNTVLNPMVKIEGIFKNDPPQEACVHIIIRTPERGSSEYLFSSSSDDNHMTNYMTKRPSLSRQEPGNKAIGMMWISNQVRSLVPTRLVTRD